MTRPEPAYEEDGVICDVINCDQPATHVLVVTGARVCAVCAMSLERQGCSLQKIEDGQGALDV